MIDRTTLEEMRRRRKAAEPAVAAVRLHSDGGIFGPLPADEAAELLPAAVASAEDVPTLLDEVDRLSPASYLSGPEACCEGECDEEDPPDGQWCSHVTERVATLADVKRAEYLDTLVQSLREAAQRVQRGEPADSSGALRPLHELILTGAENTYDRIKQWQTTGEEPTW